MAGRRRSYNDCALGLANSLYTLDRLATLDREEVEEAAWGFALKARISRPKQFTDTVLRQLQRLREGKESWSERREATSA